MYVNGVLAPPEAIYHVGAYVLAILGVAVIIILLELRSRWRSRVKQAQAPASNKTLRRRWAVAVAVCLAAMANHYSYFYPDILSYHLWFLGDVAIIILMILRWRSYIKSKNA